MIKKRKQYSKPYLKELGSLTRVTKNNSSALYCDKHGKQKNGQSNC